MTPTAHDVGTARHGPLLVLAHGLEDDWRTFSALGEHLPGWRAVAVELPWRGGNDYRWRRRGTPAELLHDALRALPERPALVVGHSFGANALLELMTAHDVTDAAVLVAPSYLAPGVRVTWQMFDGAQASFRRRMTEGVRARLPVDEEHVTALSAKIVDRMGPGGFLAVFDQFLASAQLPLADVRAPVLVLSDEREPDLDQPRLQPLVAGLPDGRLHCAPEFDHFCHVRDAAGVAAAIHRFTAAQPTERETAPHADR